MGEKFFAPTDPVTNQENNADINDNDFIKMIIRAKEYIHAGDIFQVVLSRFFKKKYTVEPFKIYRVLREKNPTCPGPPAVRCSLDCVGLADVENRW